MRFKLDENFGKRTLNIFQAAGHDVRTTLDEGMVFRPAFLRRLGKLP